MPFSSNIFALWQQLASDQNLYNRKYWFILYTQCVLTSLRYSKHPETGYALVTNFATVCMLINPFQMVLRRERKREVSPSWGDRASVTLQDTNMEGRKSEVNFLFFFIFYCPPWIISYIFSKWINMLQRCKPLYLQGIQVSERLM